MNIYQHWMSMYRQQSQMGWLGLGGLFAPSRPAIYRDQPFHGLVPPQLQRGLGCTNWRDLINQAIDIANGEHQDAQIEIMRLSSENEKLKAIVEKPDWCEVFKRKDS